MAGYIGSKSSVTLVDGYTEAEADAEFVTKTGDTMTGDLSFGDNDKAKFGAGDDLQVYHDGSNSYIDDAGTGNLYLRASNAIIMQSSDGAETIASFHDDNLCRLYYDNSVKLSTTSTGATIRGDGDAILLLNTASDAGDKSLIRFGDNDDADAGYIDYDHGTNSLAFGASAAERMRIDSSGNVLVGRTQTGDSTAGGMIRPDGFAQFTRDGNIAADFKRINSDGDIVRFQKDSATVGSIGVNAGSLGIGQSNTGLGFFNTDNMVFPATAAGATRDNAIDLGYSAARFDDIYATNGTIQTSDFNEKQDIASLTATEMLVGKRISALFKTFRWKDSVAENGDNARTHTGVIAQDVQAAFTAEGLDAGDYALFISSTWWETQTEVPAVEAVEAVEAVTETTTDEDGNEVVTVITETVEAVEAKDAYTRTDTYDTEAEAPEGATSKTRMGIRYPELLSFVAAYNEQRFASIEARLTALEA